MRDLRAAEHALTKGDSESARQAAERALAAGASRAEVAGLIARVLLTEGRAEEALRTAESEGAGTDAGELARVEALIALGRHEEAARAAEALASRRPALAAARLLLGRALHYAGDPLRAAREARRAVELAPDDADARARLGGMLLGLGRVRDALAELEHALALDPALPTARANLAAALVAEGRHAEALDVLEPLARGTRLDAETAAGTIELLEQVYDAERDPRAAALVDSIRSKHAGARTRVPAGPDAPRPWRARRSVLESAARELVALARRGVLDPVCGRDAEVDALLDVLLRKKKSNPLLVGPPGVGKSAVVEALARRVSEGRVPERLRGARIWEVSLASLLADSAFRGEFEQKLEALVEELRGDRRNLLFLDEVHTLVGAGAGAGGLGAAEVLKPALARGEIALIGATTEEAYERTIARDPALARRFTRVPVREPEGDAARAMLDAAACDLAEFHGVTFDPDAIEAALELTGRYVADRALPDKGIDALDQAAVRAIRAGRVRVGAEEVLLAVAAMARIPLTSIRRGGAAMGRLTGLAARLRAYVRGQDAACERVAEVLLVRGLGLGIEVQRPRGVFLFVGPPGVGKTSLARALAEELHGGADHLVRIDMSELMERHEVARLVGAPAGYVGHEEGGMLTRALRARPASVVLLDEIEKAHPDALNLFLQVFDAGRLTDGRGETVDARQATFVMTSNLSERHWGPSRMGFSRSTDEHAFEASVVDRVRARLPPELLGRVDAVVAFGALTREALEAITSDHLTRAVEALRREGVVLHIGQGVAAAIAQAAERADQGARAVSREVEARVLLPAARALLAGGTTRLEARAIGAMVEVVALVD